MKMQTVRWRMGRAPGRIRSTGRALGQDTDEVLTDAGLVAEEIAGLRWDGFVG